MHAGEKKHYGKPNFRNDTVSGGSPPDKAGTEFKNINLGIFSVQSPTGLGWPPVKVLPRSPDRVSGAQKRGVRSADQGGF